MGILNNALGINLTDNDPLNNSPFTVDNDNGFATPPGPEGYLLELVSPLSPFTLLDGEFMTLL